MATGEVMGKLPTGTVTFVFTDIESSTRLLRRLGDDYDKALHDHRRLLRDAFSSCGGVEVDTQGDAFFVSFGTAADAIEAVADAQKALAQHHWPQGLELLVRMGVHTGEPRVTSEGYVGEDVHIGARICAAAHGGQVLISQATAQLLPDHREGYRLKDLGEHSLKDLSGRQRLYQLDIEGLRSDFPPIRTLDTRPHNLPRQLSPLIGRDHEAKQLSSLLRREDAAVVTLTGPGGTGKTRLALQVTAELIGDFCDGAFFVDLSSITDPTLVIPTVARALSLKEPPGTTITEALTEYLAGKELLLVLDNFEQVVSSAEGISSLIAAAPRLKILVTSREALRISGEREFPVPPLPLPPSDTAGLQELMASPAVALFAERAEASKPGFRVMSDNAYHIAEICRRLDGLPLAKHLRRRVVASVLREERRVRRGAQSSEKELLHLQAHRGRHRGLGFARNAGYRRR